MAVDLGTANTLVYVRGRGIILNEPSVVAIDDRTALGKGVDGLAMLGERKARKGRALANLDVGQPPG